MQDEMNNTARIMRMQIENRRFIIREPSFVDHASFIPSFSLQKFLQRF
jgi:hypothetical protein